MVNMFVVIYNLIILHMNAAHRSSKARRTNRLGATGTIYNNLDRVRLSSMAHVKRETLLDATGL